jgi:hypothetical protein
MNLLFLHSGEDIHDQWAPRLRRLAHRCWLGAFGVFLALRWMTLEKVIGVGAMSRWLYLAAMALAVGGGVIRGM